MMVPTACKQVNTWLAALIRSCTGLLKVSETEKGKLKKRRRAVSCSVLRRRRSLEESDIITDMYEGKGRTVAEL